MTPELQAALDRCQRELALAREAYFGAALGIQDWLKEEAKIRAEFGELFRRG